MRLHEIAKGRHAPSRQYFFGSQDGVMGASMQSRIPDISPAENVINTLLDVFFFEITPRERGQEASNADVGKVVQLLGNPLFLLTCEGAKRKGDKDPGLTLKAFVFSHVLWRSGNNSRAKNFKQTTGGDRLHLQSGESVPQLFASERYGSRFFNFDANLSVEEMVRRAEEWRDHLASNNPGKQVWLPHDNFESYTAAVRWGLEQTRPFASSDFSSMVARFAKHGAIPDASRSDKACESGIELYRAMVNFAVNYASLIITEKEIKRLVDAHQLPSLAEAGKVAFGAVESRLTAARAEYRELESARERKAIELGAARLEEFRREEIAAQKAEQKRLKLVERDRAQALKDFHSRFQEIAISENVEGLLSRLESGSGIPTHLRGQGELIVTQILNPLRHYLLDLRGDGSDHQGDPAVQRLGTLIFSPTTIAIIAKSFGIDSEKCLHVAVPSGRSASESAVSELSELYESSHAAQGMIKTMLDQSDGIIAVAALALPPSEVARYARQRDWSGAGTDQSGGDARRPLAAKLQKVIEDKIIVRVARESMPRPEPIPEKKKSQIELPAWIEEVINPEEFAYSLEEGQLLIAAREAPNLAIYIPAKGFATKEVFQKEYKQRLNVLLADIEVERRLETFKALHGFSVSRERDARGWRVELNHQDYELSLSLDGLPKKWFASLDTLEQRFQQHETSWAMLFERAKRVGFEVIRNHQGLGIRHAEVGEHWIGFGVFAPIGQLHRVTALVDDAERRLERRSFESKAQDRRARKVERALQEEVLPGLHDEIVVPDANVFMTLVAPREGGGSWLDLLASTAALKHVRVMVPAIIADFELTGRVIPFEMGQRSNDYPSMLSWTSSSVQSFKEFFEGATRVKIGRRPDGSTVVEGASLGSNRNLCVVESPGDEEFYERVRAIEREAGGNVRRFHTLARERLYHCGEGDAAITRFVESCPFLNSVTVITSDLRYMKNEMPRATGLGAPVSGCAIGSYIAAECDTRGGALSELLSGSESIHFHTIADDLSRHAERTSAGVPLLFPFVLYGQSRAPGLSARSIERIVRGE